MSGDQLLLLALLIAVIVLGLIGLRRSPPPYEPPPTVTFEEWARVYDRTGRDSKRKRNAHEDALYTAYTLAAANRRSAMIVTTPVPARPRLLRLIVRALLRGLGRALRILIGTRRSAANTLAFTGVMLCLVSLMSLDASPVRALLPYFGAGLALVGLGVLLAGPKVITCDDEDLTA